MRGAPYREGVTLEGWRERFQKALASRFALRLHMTLLMALVMGTGVLSARLLRPMTSMGLRYGVSVLVAYGAFFVLVRLWLRYASETLLSEAPREALPPEARALAGQLGEPVPEAVPDPMLVAHDDRGLLATQVGVDMAHAAVTGPPSRFRGDPSVPDVSGIGSGPSSSGSSGDASSGSSGGGGFSVDADEGVVVVVVVVAVVAVVAAVFGAAVMSVWQAPAILGEAAFEVVLAATLARAARRMEGRSWSRALWKATWGRALAVLIVAMAAGFAAQAVCPSATTMGEAVQRCVMARSAS